MHLNECLEHGEVEKIEIFLYNSDMYFTILTFFADKLQ